MRRLIWRGIVFVYREMFTGVLLGLTALFLVVKLAPGGDINAGLVAVFGLGAGLLKGFSKFLLLEMVNRIPANEYSKNYPRFKILFLWLGVFALTAIINYGFNISNWFTEPSRLIAKSPLFRGIPVIHVEIALIFLFCLGIISHIYEPPL
ncbi:hypothetical protein Tfer_1711 [Thermincola ferriacetica]|uniref:Uncharacterized protein n=1 Tax=Thermincola ferriacetica TaxID=281456 RepID=A0A0L6W2C3_9FIRM|nr:hypothetical protein [Thermincola ferriacetica]KNZ69690.1 hypothetical protein Tfer_1711 [Thermincola ferriacetica]